jgi:hypothetical protein
MGKKPVTSSFGDGRVVVVVHWEETIVRLTWWGITDIVLFLD